MNIVVWDKNVKKMEDSREEITKHLQNGYYLIQQRVDISNIFQVSFFAFISSYRFKRVMNN